MYYVDAIQGWGVQYFRTFIECQGSLYDALWARGPCQMTQGCFPCPTSNMIYKGVWYSST